MKRILFSAVVSAFAAGSFAQSLWLADGYNGFVLHNHTAANSVVEGRLAVGGNLDVSNYSVGTTLPSGTTGDTLYVMGDFKFSNGQVAQGDARTGDTTPTVSGFGVPHGSLISSPNTFWIPTIFTELIGRSGYWGHLLPTDSTLAKFGNITLTNSSNSSTAIFEVQGAEITGANNLQINSPAGSTVLVNVRGSSPKFKNAGYSLSGGITQDHVIFNFWEATSLEVSGLGLEASVLAPQADLTFNNGHIGGQVVVSSFSGGGELHNYNFGGTLPVPEPATLIAVAAGLVGIARRKKK